MNEGKYLTDALDKGKNPDDVIPEYCEKFGHSFLDYYNLLSEEKQAEYILHDDNPLAIVMNNIDFELDFKALCIVCRSFYFFIRKKLSGVTMDILVNMEHKGLPREPFIDKWYTDKIDKNDIKSLMNFCPDPNEGKIKIINNFNEIVERTNDKLLDFYAILPVWFCMTTYSLNFYFKDRSKKVSCELLSHSTDFETDIQTYEWYDRDPKVLRALYRKHTMLGDMDMILSLIDTYGIPDLPVEENDYNIIFGCYTHNKIFPEAVERGLITHDQIRRVFLSLNTCIRAEACKFAIENGISTADELLWTTSADPKEETIKYLASVCTEAITEVPVFNCDVHALRQFLELTPTDKPRRFHFVEGVKLDYGWTQGRILSGVTIDLNNMYTIN